MEQKRLEEERRCLLRRAPEGYGYSSCCVLMCEALVFSVMLISMFLCCVGWCHMLSSFAFVSLCASLLEWTITGSNRG